MRICEKTYPAIFLDRDGVICKENKKITLPSETEIFPYARDCIGNLKKFGYIVIVITNQSGIARGLYEEQELIDLNKKMKKDLGIYDIYYCPHHKNGIIKKYALECNCRKPNTGLIEQACHDYYIDLSKSILVGDRASDMELGNKLGITTVLLNSGYGVDNLENEVDYQYNFEDLRDFVNNIDRIKKEQNI